MTAEIRESHMGLDLHWPTKNKLSHYFATRCSIRQDPNLGIVTNEVHRNPCSIFLLLGSGAGGVNLKNPTCRCTNELRKTEKK